MIKGGAFKLWHRITSLIMIPVVVFLLFVGNTTVYADEKVTCCTNELTVTDEEKAIAAMRNAFYTFAPSVDISAYNISPTTLQDLFYAVTKNDPYMFFVGNNLSYTYRKDGAVISVIPQYLMSKDAAKGRIDFCIERIRSIASIAKSAPDTLTKVLLIHDYLCLHWKYDLSYSNDNMYEFLTAESGTCQGYTWTYMAILRELGISCDYVASDSINHIWNLVGIDGEFYHVDVTWDDSVNSEGRAANVSRRHFLTSDKKARAQGHRDWYSAYGISCRSEIYDECDFDRLTHVDLICGDVDHNGRIDLFDIVRLGLYTVNIIDKDMYFCTFCADIDGDLVSTQMDIERLRGLVITGKLDIDK